MKFIFNHVYNLLVSIFPMKILNQKTLDDFDKMKDNLFAHKRKQSATNTSKPPMKNPISSVYRFFAPIALIAGGFYLVYTRTPPLKDYLIEKKHITYQQSLAWSTLFCCLKFRWESLLENKKITKHPSLANEIYLTKLKSQLIYLTQKVPEKKLEIQTKSALSFWIFNFKNEENIKYVNSYGDLVVKNRKSSLMIGDLFRFWTKVQQELIQRETIFGYYEKQLSKTHQNLCERVNIFTKHESTPEQYEQILHQCQKKSKLAQQSVRNFVIDRLKKQLKVKMTYKNNQNLQK